MRGRGGAPNRPQQECCESVPVGTRVGGVGIARQRGREIVVARRSSLLYGISLREPQIGSRLDRVPATGDRYRIVHLPDFRSPASGGSGLKAREPVGDARV